MTDEEVTDNARIAQQYAYAIYESRVLKRPTTPRLLSEVPSGVRILFRGELAEMRARYREITGDDLGGDANTEEKAP